MAARDAGAQVPVLEKAAGARGGTSRFTGGLVRFAPGGKVGVCTVERIWNDINQKSAQGS
jgi:hypothetical protein